jgi:DNA-directed RNA polymerase specialized sigma24 family protein
LAAKHIRLVLLDLARLYGRPIPLGGKHDSQFMNRTDVDSPVTRDVPDRRFDPKQLAVWSEFHERVAALPEEERTLVEHIWYLGLCQAETAQRLRVSESTVKRNWRNIKSKLSEAIEELDLDC